MPPPTAYEEARILGDLTSSMLSTQVAFDNQSMHWDEILQITAKLKNGQINQAYKQKNSNSLFSENKQNAPFKSSAALSIVNSTRFF